MLYLFLLSAILNIILILFLISSIMEAQQLKKVIEESDIFDERNLYN